MKSRIAFLAMAVVASTAPIGARAGVIFSENFTSGTDRTQILPGWTLTPSGTNDVLVLDSQDYRVGASGINDTGTGQFLAFGAGNSPDEGVATTSVPVVAGHKYDLSFLYGSFSIDPLLTQSIAITVNNTVLAAITTMGSTNDLSHVFTPYSIDFVASAGAGTLSFADVSTNTIGVDGLVDNVALSSGVPEPATWVTMLLGFAGLGFVGYRRKSLKGQRPLAAA